MTPVRTSDHVRSLSSHACAHEHPPVYNFPWTFPVHGSHKHSQSLDAFLLTKFVPAFMHAYLDCATRACMPACKPSHMHKVDVIISVNINSSLIGLDMFSLTDSGMCVLQVVFSTVAGVVRSLLGSRRKDDFDDYDWVVILTALEGRLLRSWQRYSFPASWFFAFWVCVGNYNAASPSSLTAKLQLA